MSAPNLNRRAATKQKEEVALDRRRFFREVSAANNNEAPLVSRAGTPAAKGHKVADTYKRDTGEFRKLIAGTGPVKAGFLAPTAPVAVSTDPKGDTPRVELMFKVLTNRELHPNVKEDDRFYFLARAVIESMPKVG